MTSSGLVVAGDWVTVGLGSAGRRRRIALVRAAGGGAVGWVSAEPVDGADVGQQSE